MQLTICDSVLPAIFTLLVVPLLFSNRRYELNATYIPLTTTFPEKQILLTLCYCCRKLGSERSSNFSYIAQNVSIDHEFGPKPVCFQSACSFH